LELRIGTGVGVTFRVAAAAAMVFAARALISRMNIPNFGIRFFLAGFIHHCSIGKSNAVLAQNSSKAI
jgi:hypothetical protein